jgi:hypothetical protein
MGDGPHVNRELIMNNEELKLEYQNVARWVIKDFIDKELVHRRQYTVKGTLKTRGQSKIRNFGFSRKI